MQQQTEIENTTQHQITLVLRRKTEERSAVGTTEFEDRLLNFKPGINTLTAEDAEAVEGLRRKSKVTEARFDQGELRVVEHRPGRAEVERKIRACADIDTLKRWRDGTKDKALLEIIEDQLAASTVTTDGDVVDHEVKRDSKDPRRGGR